MTKPINDKTNKTMKKSTKIKRVNKFFKDFENQALEENIDIDSEEFQEFIAKGKANMIEGSDLTMADFEEAELSRIPENQKKGIIKITKDTIKDISNKNQRKKLVKTVKNSKWGKWILSNETATETELDEAIEKAIVSAIEQSDDKDNFLREIKSGENELVNDYLDIWANEKEEGFWKDWSEDWIAKKKNSKNAQDMLSYVSEEELDQALIKTVDLAKKGIQDNSIENDPSAIDRFIWEKLDGFKDIAIKRDKSKNPEDYKLINRLVSEAKEEIKQKHGR